MESELRERIERLRRLADNPEEKLELGRLQLRVGELSAARTVFRNLASQGVQSAVQELRALRKTELIVVTETEYKATLARYRDQYSLMNWPRKERARAILLHSMMSSLSRRRYDATDLSSIIECALADLHIQGDYCHIRRYLVTVGMLDRERDGSAYWRSDLYRENFEFDVDAKL